MLYVSGDEKNEAKWLYENFIDGYTLILEPTKRKFPKFETDIHYVAKFNDFNLVDFMDKYESDPNTKNIIKRILFYNVGTEESASFLEQELKKHYEHFQVVFAKTQERKRLKVLVEEV